MTQQNNHSANPTINKLLSLSYQCLSQYMGASDTFTHYLLGITGIIVSFVFLEFEKFDQFFSIQTIFLSLFLFLLSGLSGMCAKFLSHFRKGAMTLDQSLQEKLPDILSEGSLNDKDLDEFCRRLYASTPIVGKILLKKYSSHGAPQQLSYEFSYKFGAYQQIFTSSQFFFLISGFVLPVIEICPWFD